MIGVVEANTGYAINSIAPDNASGDTLISFAVVN